jgi:bisphosphoglycerate-dependent phosphoglycerate mutase
LSSGLSEKIRSLARSKYVAEAASTRKGTFEIRVRDVITELQKMGIPPTYTPQICSALQTRRFLTENGLVIESVDGPPKKVSPTVVIHYRFLDPAAWHAASPAMAQPAESPEQRAQRLTGKLRGLLKDEIAAHGGSEAFLRWVRGYDEDAA